jgi:hypothetical protein
VAQINLLKQNTTNSFDFSRSIPKILVRLFLVVLLCLLGYYGWLYFQVKKIDSDTIALNAKMAGEVSLALGTTDRNELLTRQLQIKTLSGLISSHLYWSQILKPLADATLQTATYTSIETLDDGTLSISGSVPSYEELEKYLQAFNLSDVYQNFSDVLLGGYVKNIGKTPDSSNVNFQVIIKYNPDLIQYKPSNNNAS